MVGKYPCCPLFWTPRGCRGKQSEKAAAAPAFHKFTCKYYLSSRTDSGPACKRNDTTPCPHIGGGGAELNNLYRPYLTHPNILSTHRRRFKPLARARWKQRDVTNVFLAGPRFSIIHPSTTSLPMLAAGKDLAAPPLRPERLDRRSLLDTSLSGQSISLTRLKP